MYVDLAAGQVLKVGDVRIKLEHKSGRAARLVVSAPKDIPIQRPGRDTQPSAQECASTPVKGLEHTNGKHPL